MATVTSRQWLLNARDFLHAFFLAVATAPATIIYNSIQAGNFHPDWTNIWHVALAGASAYLFKALFTPSQTITTNVSATPPAK